MRVWFDSDDAYEDVEDWQEMDFYHASNQHSNWQNHAA